MSKKIILLALAAASVAAFALPATAAAAEVDTALHLTPAPVGAKTVHGEGKAQLFGALGLTITCEKHKGTATFTSTTGGTFQQTFEECWTSEKAKQCTGPGEPPGQIKTTVLPFHLVTAVDTVNGSTGPGILVTPKEEHFATFTCAGHLPTTVRGSGLVGTITKVAHKGVAKTICGTEEANEATLSFTRSAGSTQTHKTVASEEVTAGGVVDKRHTSTEYNLTAFGAAAAEEAFGNITLETTHKLVCT